MKKLIIFLITAITILSCKKNSALSETEVLTSDNPAIRQVFNESNVALQKNMYRLLSVNEKLEVWDKKFALLLSSNKLNDNQKVFIKGIKNDLSLYFSKNYKISEVDNKNLKDKAVQLFGVNEAFNILANVNEAQPLIIQPPPDCSCSRASDYCDGTSSCSFAHCTDTNGGWWYPMAI